MSAIKLRVMKSIFEAELLLNGGLKFPKSYRGDEKILGLNGLTLVFTAPSGTVTFVDTTNAGLLIKQITDRIHAQVAGLQATLRDGNLWVIQSTPTAGVALDGSASTARTIFGFPASSVSGTKYAPPSGAAPRMLAFGSMDRMDGFLLQTEE